MGQDVVYRRSRIFGERKRVDLVFSDRDQTLTVRQKGTTLEQIPFAAIAELSFADAKRRRIHEAGELLWANVNAGIMAIVTVPATVPIAVTLLFTKETKHRLNIAFESIGGRRTLSLQLDKSEYEKVLETIRSQTGERVVVLPRKR